MHATGSASVGLSMAKTTSLPAAVISATILSSPRNTISEFSVSERSARYGSVVWKSERIAVARTTTRAMGF